MRKLVQGVINFHQNVLPGIREQFAHLALGQSPDALMIACSDGRVVPNLFASTDPGDLFVVRNIGNMVPPAHPHREDSHGESEVAALEIAVEILQVADIIVCGHSQCAGMASLLTEAGVTQNVKQWIRHGQPARQWLDQGRTLNPALTLQDQLSQLNVMHQLDNVRTYPLVNDRVTAGTLRLHGWWFDIGSGNVYAFEPDEGKFVVIDATEGARILQRIGS